MHRRSGAHPCQDPLGPAAPTHGPMLPGAAAQTANGALSPVEQTKRSAIMPVCWEPRGDQVTPTIKLNRQAIAARYAQRHRVPVRRSPPRRRKPAELTPVATPVLKSPGTTAPPPAAAHTQRAGQLA